MCLVSFLCVHIVDEQRHCNNKKKKRKGWTTNTKSFSFNVLLFCFMIVERLFWLSLVWSPPCVGENNKQTKRGESARGSIKQYFIFLLLMIRWREGKRQGTFAYLIFFTFILCWCGLMRLCVSLWICRPFRRTWRAPCWARAEPIHTDGRAASKGSASSHKQSAEQRLDRRVRPKVKLYLIYVQHTTILFLLSAFFMPNMPTAPCTEYFTHARIQKINIHLFYAFQCQRSHHTFFLIGKPKEKGDRAPSVV